MTQGNALLPPHDVLNVSSTEALQSIHSRLDPNSPGVEDAWKRRDIYGLILIPYALLLSNAASQPTSPRGSGSAPSPLSPDSKRSPRASGRSDFKNTFSKCLMVASQLKSLTFARLSLLPSFGMPSSRSSHKDATLTNHVDDASSFDFYVSVFADFTAQYIDALYATRNLPITRQEWFDDESKLAQSEWMEKEQKRQFGLWAGQAVEEDMGGPRAVNIMDRPDCLEDVFALVSSICSTYPAGAKAFWSVVEEQEMDEDGCPTSTAWLHLAPSRFLRMLDLIQSENDSLLSVYVSFLASLALSDGTDDNEASNGASMVHSFLSGERTINSQSDRHVAFNWANVMIAIRWFAEQLGPDDEGDGSKNSPAERLRRSNAESDNMMQSSTSYYYGLGVAGTTDTGREGSSSSHKRAQQGQSTSSSSINKTTTKELDEVGRNTLMSLLCLISNVVSRSSAAREHILALQVPLQSNEGSSEFYQDGCLEILFCFRS